jgi:tRNA/rRNA methyltransferase
MSAPTPPRGGIEALPPAPVVILCRPQLGENVGTTARAMLNFGLVDLRLVRPDCGWPNAKAVAAASGATEVLNRLETFSTLEAAIGDLHHVLATTARPRELRKPVMTGEAAAVELHRLLDEGRRVGLVFGAERSGLTNDELLLADALVSVPLNPAFSSLNLAQAVLLLGYEWFKATDRTPALRPPPGKDPPATKAEVLGVTSHLLAELDAIDWFRAADRRVSLARTIEVMIERRGWSRPEIHLMRGIIKDLARGGRGRGTSG